MHAILSESAVLVEMQILKTCTNRQVCKEGHVSNLGDFGYKTS